MNRVSKKLSALILCTGAVALAGQSGRAALPSGNYDQHVTSDSNPIWDVTRVVPLNALNFGVGGNANVDLQCQVSFTMDGAGKLNGKGTTDILVDSDSFTGMIPGATYKVTGSVTSHEAWGLGVYGVFSYPNVNLENAIEAPSNGAALFHSMVTVSIVSNGQINHIVNGVGGTATPNVSNVPRLTSYP